VWIITALFAAIILAAATIKVDQVVASQGELIARLPTLVVQPFDTSIVRSIEIRVGEKVRAGQVLGRLNPTFASADLTALTAQVAYLQALVARLSAEASDKPFKTTDADTDKDVALQNAIYGQ